MSNLEKPILALISAVILLACCLAATTLFAQERGPGGAVTGASASGVETRAAQLLEQGRGVERELAVGEVHSYGMKLAAGQLVSLLFKREGVPLVAALFDPEGNKIEQLGSSFAREGDQTITFQTATAGMYRLELRTFLKPKPPGRYLVKLLEVRAASAKDAARQSRQQTQESCREQNWVDGQGAFQVKLILTSLAGCMSAVADKLKPNYPEALEVANFTKAQVGFLNSRWHWGESVSAAYQNNLKADFQVLEFAAELSDQAKALAILREVADDVKIKAAHCSKSTRAWVRT
jgi:hypothetical protein